MAYINQEQKKQIAPKVKAILKKYGCKGTMGIRNHSTLYLRINEGRLNPFADLVSGPNDHAKRYGTLSANPHWYHEHYQGKTKEMLREVLLAMNEGNHDNSQAEYDYFDVGWYVDVDFGDWKKAYKLLT